eukprot:8116869-Prorocentrum_lima.AAC.1
MVETIQSSSPPGLRDFQSRRKRRCVRRARVQDGCSQELQKELDSIHSRLAPLAGAISASESVAEFLATEVRL